MGKTKGLLERLNAGDKVICAEGYLFEFERRGYLKAGAFVPEVVIEHPDLVKALHEEFVHCGSDVVQAFTFYGHREKMRVIGREDELEKMNRDALRIARKVADDTGTLMAGNICTTTMFTPGDPVSAKACRDIFTEQVRWAVEEGADFIIGETFQAFGEAKLALEVIKEIDPKMPAVITITPTGLSHTGDGLSFADALCRLEQCGADVVGLNCMRGPATTLSLMPDIREACKGPLACLPVPYRTSEKDGLCMHHLKDELTGGNAFPADLDAWLVSRTCIERMTRDLVDLGVTYMGVCCGSRPVYIRTMAETLGRSPPASKYSPDMTQHFSQVQPERNQYAQSRWHLTKEGKE